MNFKFKIYFKDKSLEGKVLEKGEFENFHWNKLRDTIIHKSKNFRSFNKELKDKDDFILEFGELPKNFIISLKSFWNLKTYNYFLEKLKSWKEKNPNEEIKVIKLYVSKVDKLPKWNAPKYDVVLKNTLENTWKNEEEKIKNQLNDLGLANGKKAFLSKNSKSKEYENNNVICNSCLSVNFIGYRYICAYCNNFNLCQNCFCLGEHNKEHNFILFRNPIDEDILKYNNKFSPYEMVFKNINDTFFINFKVANTGEKDLDKCFISYILFNGNYLWSEKFIVNEKFLKNESKDIKLKINFKNNAERNGIFEGHFRMFTEKGIPFGDILKVRIKNDKL